MNGTFLTTLTASDQKKNLLPKKQIGSAVRQRGQEGAVHAVRPEGPDCPKDPVRASSPAVPATSTVRYHYPVPTTNNHHSMPATTTNINHPMSATTTNINHPMPTTTTVSGTRSVHSRTVSSSRTRSVHSRTL